MLTLYVFFSMLIFIALVVFVVSHDILVTAGFFNGDMLSTGIFRWSVLLFVLSWLPFVNIIWIPVIVFIVYNVHQAKKEVDEKIFKGNDND